MSKSSIPWTDRTWNPIRGCSRISAGCDNCYAVKRAHRFSKPGMPFHGYVDKQNGKIDWTGQVELIDSQMQEPGKWPACKVFVCSMSDLFHGKNSYFNIEWIMSKMLWTYAHHLYLVLTKRPDRALSFTQYRYREHAVCGPIWLEDIWLGVSVENQDTCHRIETLKQIPAPVRWVSFEPLIGPVDNIDLRGINWVVIGGETGPADKRRPLKPEWTNPIFRQCHDLNIPLFFKGWGGRSQHDGDALLFGKKWEQFPDIDHQALRNGGSK